MVVFFLVLLFGPETDNYVPIQAAFGGIALAMFLAAYVRARATRRHFKAR